jgi:hypothetical protein
VGTVRIEANGAVFACTSPSDAEQNAAPLNLNSIFQDLGDQPWPRGLAYQAGALTRGDVPAGASVVPLRLPGEADRFEAGSPVLVHSFDQQGGGYPPNLRFFEWRQVAAVDRGAGELRLDRPLRFAHDAALPDVTLEGGLGPVIGRARVMRLNRSTYRYPARIEIEDAVFARNPAQPADAANGLRLPADTLILRRCRHEGWLWPSENRVALFEGCRFARVEVDKLCGRVVFRDCRCGPVIGATGAMELVLERCAVDGAVMVSPRRARIASCTIRTPADDPWGAIRPYYDTWPVERLECVDNTVVPGGALHFAINGGHAHPLTVAARGQGNAILLDDTPHNRDEVIRRLMAGMVLRRQGDGATGRVSRIGWTGAAWSIAGDWTAPVAPGQVWEFANVQAIVERGTRIAGKGVPLLRPPFATQAVL